MLPRYYAFRDQVISVNFATTSYDNFFFNLLQLLVSIQNKFFSDIELTPVLLFKL